ncbi:hypothetical protein VYU27_006492 [Nannochloropsis oceanica]
MRLSTLKTSILGILMRHRPSHRTGDRMPNQSSGGIDRRCCHPKLSVSRSTKATRSTSQPRHLISKCDLIHPSTKPPPSRVPVLLSMRLGVSACPLTFATICLVFHLQAPSCIEAAAVTSCIATTTTTTRRVIFSSVHTPRSRYIFSSAAFAATIAVSKTQPPASSPPLVKSIRMTASSSSSSSASSSSPPAASTTAPPSPRPKAELTSDLIRCGAFLRVGGLVAFPTETVYGLGANAYMEKSVERIFEVKGRPLTDPLIVHVAQAEEAWAVFACGSAANSSSSSSSEAQAAHHAKEKQLISTLAASFWPGPLTLVAPAAADLPLAVSAGTGWVGVRVPSHPLARALLRAASVPVVAPSANRFGHVSPTSAAHVEADLGGHTMLILEGGREGEGDGEKAVCEIGIESTVVKVDAKEGRLTVLRAGAITCSQLKACVKGMDVEVLVKDHSSSSSSSANHHHHQQQQQQQGRKILAEDDSEPQIAPGQCIKHYAPDRPTYLLSPSRALEGWAAAVAKQAVVLDVGGRLGGLEGVAVFYRDLSRKGDPREAAARLFEGLRWAESAERKGVKGELVVLVVDLREEGGTRGAQEDKEFEMALMDRVMRSASGQEAGAFLLEG